MDVVNGPLLKSRKPIRAIYVSSYIPRKCGIATYTKDLTNAINLLNPYALSEIMAMHRSEETPTFPWEVKYKIEEQDLTSYIQAADYVNVSSADIVVIEHEFGLFGGNCGEYIVHFAEKVTKPLIVTCHTIMEDPNSDYGLLFQRLARRADALVVMMDDSAQKLISRYNIPSRKVVVIPHGTPDLSFSPTDAFKKAKRIGINRLVLGNINLLSENKGIEFAIEAMKEIVKEVPDALYVVVGQTHPGVKKNEGEKYRNYLKKLVRTYKLQKNVRFVNEYLSLQELIEWLRVMDFYITPYLDPQQSSSGALAYAIGAGKLCVSTPYIYAKEVIDGDRGVLVPFKESKAIAEAVLKLWNNKKEMDGMRRKTYEYGRLMTWSNVALGYLDLFNALIVEK